MVSNEVAKSPATTNEKRQEETASSSQNSRESPCSGRVSKQPIRYEHEVQMLVSDTNKYDPLTFKDAMNDFDKDKWQDAMNQEMESMYSNSVWVLEDPPENIKPIGCKWILKKKRGADGKVETFKARLVAKGYTQKKRG